MAELPKAIYAKIEKLCAQGDEHEDNDDFDEALHCFQDAWELLPEPRLEWPSALWILGAIGDVQYLREDYTAGRDAIQLALDHFEEAQDNPFLRMRLGQCLVELGNAAEALPHLKEAYMTEGDELFEEEDSKFVELIKRHLDVPPTPPSGRR